MGILTQDNNQIVFYDTPGILPENEANKYQKELSTVAWDIALGMDALLLVIDSVKHLSTAEYQLFRKAKELKQENPKLLLILALNKVDLVEPKSKLSTIHTIVSQ